nr:hypothetical protein [Umezawaea beigongshangensis]
MAGGDADAGGEAGAGVAAAQVGQDQQCLASGVEPAPPAADPPSMRGQLPGEELKVRTGQVDRGRADKHTKLLAMALLLVDKSSTRSSTTSPPRPQPTPPEWKGLTVVERLAKIARRSSILSPFWLLTEA